MFTKKGQGLSLNVVIIAALALIVLVVLILVFTGRINVFQKDIGDVSGAKSCSESGGECAGNCKPGTEIFGRWSDCRPGQIHCCRTGGATT